MLATYKGLGVECCYPENWTVQEGSQDDDSQGFLIESPDAAFFAVTEFPWSCSPKEVLAQASQALSKEYEECETEGVESDVSVSDSQAIEMRFFLMDMLVVAKLRAFSLNQRTYLVEQQAEDREYQKVEAVFEAMLETLIQSMDKSHGLKRLHQPV